MKKIISLLVIGLVLLTFSSVVMAEETVFPLRDHPHFETHMGSSDISDIDDWHEDMLENQSTECPTDGSGYRGNSMHRGQGFGNNNTTQTESGNGYGRGMGNGL